MGTCLTCIKILPDGRQLVIHYIEDGDFKHVTEYHVLQYITMYHHGTRSKKMN